MDIALAGVVGVLAPFFYKLVPLKGVSMILATLVLSMALAFADVFVTKGSGSFDAANIGATFATIFTLSQVVFIAFQKNEPAAVTEAAKPAA